jgi:hypothetical protein
MFGTARPRPCALPGPDRQAFRHLYCGTCKGLHAYGTPTRALTSWDAVLLGAIVEGLQDEAAPYGTCRCPLNPLVHKPIVAGAPAEPERKRERRWRLGCDDGCCIACECCDRCVDCGPGDSGCVDCCPCDCG